MFRCDVIVNGKHIGNDLVAAVRIAELAEWSIGGGGVTVATMVVRIGVIAAGSEEIGEASITCGVFGETVADLHNTPCLAFSTARIKVERCAGG